MGGRWAGSGDPESEVGILQARCARFSFSPARSALADPESERPACSVKLSRPRAAQQHQNGDVPLAKLDWGVSLRGNHEKRRFPVKAAVSSCCRLRVMP
jgi:hypothetical protein